MEGGGSPGRPIPDRGEITPFKAESDAPTAQKPCRLSTTSSGGITLHGSRAPLCRILLRP